MNGFRFHTVRHGATRSTSNSVVTLIGSNNTNNEISYYGNIEEIIEMEYPGLPIKRIVLFKCPWFDPTPKTGTRNHLQYELFDVNNNKTLNVYEPFIFDVQASQVFFVTYPNVKRSAPECWQCAKCRQDHIFKYLYLVLYHPPIMRLSRAKKLDITSLILRIQPRRKR